VATWRGPAVPRGNLISGRPISDTPQYTGNPTDTAALVAHVYSAVPTNYAEPVTHTIYPSAVFAKDEVSLLARVMDVNHRLEFVAAPTPAVTAKASQATHLLVLVNNLKSREVTTLNAIAAAMSAGASNRGRGGVQVFFGDYRGFPEWAPAEDIGKFTLVPISLKGGKLDGALLRTTSADIADIPRTLATLADRVESLADYTEAKRTQVANAQAGAARMLAPSTSTESPLRRIDTTQQFVKEVAELKSGVAVIFMLRESDTFYSKHLKVAKKVAEDAVTNFNVEMAGKPAIVKFEVFMIDAEVHKNAAHELRVPEVPSVAFLVELRDKQGVKGLRHFKSKNFDKAADIIKFMRKELFDGRDMTTVDPMKVRFASTVPASKLTDVTLRTDYFDTDPRRFDAVAAEESKSEEVAVLGELLRNTVNRLVKGKDGAATSGPTGKKGGAAKKNETPEQTQKREAKEAKLKAAAEAQKAKIKAEIEAREKAKQEQIEKKKADEAAIAEKRKQAIDAKTKDAKDRRAREEADGTAGKRRAAEKARKARLERTKKLKKAKLAAKTPKDRATMVRLAAEDSQQAAKQYMVKGDDGSIKVLDRLL
jgi:hypothetical protein